MSEEKLKLPQKLFAALERLIRETHVKDLDLGVTVTTAALDYSLRAVVRPLDFAVPVQVSQMPVTIESQTIEIVHRFTHSPIQDASLQGLTAQVKEEPLETINTAAVISEPLDIVTTTAVYDLFKEYQIEPGHLSSALSHSSAGAKSSRVVKTIDIDILKPRVHQVSQSKFNITAKVNENLALFRRLTLQKKNVILSFLSEKEQLVYWKRAVNQTKKEARHLQMIGVYTGIPYDCVENIKVNYSEQSMNYNFKARAQGSRCELKDIALFNDSSTNKILMVLK